MRCPPTVSAAWLPSTVGFKPSHTGDQRGHSQASLVPITCHSIWTISRHPYGQVVTHSSVVCHIRNRARVVQFQCPTALV